MRTLLLSGLVALAAGLGGPALLGSAPAAAATVPAALHAAVRPADVEDVAQIGSKISCASPTACLAVGTNNDRYGDETIPVAQALHGTTWKTIAVKEPKGAIAASLTGVSCKAATYCLVLGAWNGTDQVTHPTAWTWNGTALTLLPGLPVPLPKADELVSLSGVSCVAVKSCVVFGSALSPGISEGSPGSIQLVWTWNGSKWAVKTATVSGTGSEVELDAARCFSLTSCVVAGTGFAMSGTAFTETLASATWNGKAFSTQEAAVPAGLGAPLIGGLSCSSLRSCALVGASVSLSDTSSTLFGFAEVWNGTAWTVTKWTGPKGSAEALLLGVACTSATSCLATGAAGSDKVGHAAALSYNGTKWSVLKVPGVGKGLTSAFEGVSCPKAGDCVAIGEYGPSSASNGKPLAGYWNGRTWTIKVL